MLGRFSFDCNKLCGRFARRRPVKSLDNYSISWLYKGGNDGTRLPVDGINIIERTRMEPWRYWAPACPRRQRQRAGIIQFCRIPAGAAEDGAGLGWLPRWTAEDKGDDLFETPKNIENKYKYVPDVLAELSGEMKILYNETIGFISSLGEDISTKFLKRYIAFSKLKNFVCMAPFQKQFRLWLKLNPNEIVMEDGFSSNVSERGHWGTGDVELIVRNLSELEKAKPYIIKAYQENWRLSVFRLHNLPLTGVSMIKATRAF